MNDIDMRPRWLRVAFGFSFLLGCASAPESQPIDGDGGNAGASEGDGGDTGDGDGGENAGGGGQESVCEWSACGGEVARSWTYAPFCLDDVPKVDSGCAGGYSQYKTYVQGTLDLSTPGSAAVDTALVSEIHVYWPKSCWPPGAQGCEDFVQADDFVLVCENAADSCSCVITDVQISAPSVATYSVDGDALTFDDGSETVQFSFCAGESQLVLIHDTGERSYLQAE